MQISVTKNKCKKIGKSGIKSVVSTVLILLFAVVSTAILVSARKKTLIFDEQLFYVVSVGESKKNSGFDAKKELLKNLGGANVVYNSGGNFYLIANVYLDLESANEIKTNMAQYFPDAKIVKIKTKSVSGQSKKAIKNNDEARNLLKFLYSKSKEFQKMELGVLSGEISDSKFLLEMTRIRLELEKLNNCITSEDETSKTIRGFGELFLLQMTNFLTGFSVSQSRNNYICNYFVGFFVNYVELYASL